MEDLQAGDRFELFYEDAPGTTIRATVGRLLTDREEGMGVEVEEYIACWVEITVDEPGEMDANHVLFAWDGFPVSAKRLAGHSP
jgi:hypothetical protein